MSNTLVRTRPASPVDVWLRDFFGPATAPFAGLNPAAEVVRDGDDAVVRLELPGVNVAEDVTVELERGRLVIRGERRDERAESAEGRTISEIRYGSFHRSFKVPAQVGGDAVTASYDDGVLTVRVAGVYAGSEPQRIAITTK